MYMFMAFHIKKTIRYRVMINLANLQEFLLNVETQGEETVHIHMFSH